MQKCIQHIKIISLWLRSQFVISKGITRSAAAKLQTAQLTGEGTTGAAKVLPVPAVHQTALLNIRYASN